MQTLVQVTNHLRVKKIYINVQIFLNKIGLGNIILIKKEYVKINMRTINSDLAVWTKLIKDIESPNIQSNRQAL